MEQFSLGMSSLIFKLFASNQDSGCAQKCFSKSNKTASSHLECARVTSRGHRQRTIRDLLSGMPSGTDKTRAFFTLARRLARGRAAREDRGRLVGLKPVLLSSCW